MKLLIKLFSTIRIFNLAIICFSLVLVRYTVVLPILELSGTTSTIQHTAYLWMMLATLLIAAGGYVINDYFDSGIDAINKPGKNNSDTYFTRRQMLMLYWMLTLLGLATGWYFGFLLGIRYPVLLFLLSAGLLYFYSSSYKKMLIAGNLVISFLSALTLALPLLFDRVAMNISPIVILTVAYALYAFMMTLIREMIKDVEDAEGDAAFGATTLAIVAGSGVTRMICTMLTIITAASIVYIQIVQSQWENPVSFGYTTLFILLPLLILAWKIYTAKTKQDDHRNSTFTKIIMVTGLLSMLVFYITSG